MPIHVTRVHVPGLRRRPDSHLKRLRGTRRKSGPEVGVFVHGTEVLISAEHHPALLWNAQLGPRALGSFEIRLERGLSVKFFVRVAIRFHGTVTFLRANTPRFEFTGVRRETVEFTGMCLLVVRAGAFSGLSWFSVVIMLESSFVVELISGCHPSVSWFPSLNFRHLPRFVSEVVGRVAV